MAQPADHAAADSWAVGSEIQTPGRSVGVSPRPGARTGAAGILYPQSIEQVFALCRCLVVDLFP